MDFKRPRRRLYNKTWCVYGRHIVRRRRHRRWTRAPGVHAASHVDHKTRAASISISKHVCGSVWCCMVLHLAAFSAAELRYDFKVIARWIAGFSIYFSNSLIIYQVKAKEMTTMIPGLN